MEKEAGFIDMFQRYIGSGGVGPKSFREDSRVLAPAAVRMVVPFADQGMTGWGRACGTWKVLFWL